VKCPFESSNYWTAGSNSLCTVSDLVCCSFLVFLRDFVLFFFDAMVFLLVSDRPMGGYVAYMQFLRQGKELDSPSLSRFDCAAKPVNAVHSRERGVELFTVD
jgi:hypothetical protein